MATKQLALKKLGKAEKQQKFNEIIEQQPCFQGVL